MTKDITMMSSAALRERYNIMLTQARACQQRAAETGNKRRRLTWLHQAERWTELATNCAKEMANRPSPDWRADEYLRRRWETAGLEYELAAVRETETAFINATRG